MLLAYLSIRKVPASLALMASTLFAGVLGAFLQPDVYADFVAGTGNVVVESIKAVWPAMANGFYDRHRASPTSTGCCPAAAWTACCSPSG